MKRITVIMPDEVYDKVIALCGQERKKKSTMAAMLIEDGLKLSEPTRDEVSNALKVLENKLLSDAR